MPRAVAPLFVAAVLILIVGAIVAGIRFGDDGAPTAVGPTETETATGPDTTDTDTEAETETESPSPTPSPTDTATASPSPSPTETETGGQAQPGDTESPGDGASPSPTESPTDGREPVAIDDMPDTGGGAAAALAGFLVLTGAAGLASRDR